MHKTSKVLSYASWHQSRFATKVLQCICGLNLHSDQLCRMTMLSSVEENCYATFLNCYSSLILNNKIAIQENKSNYSLPYIGESERCEHKRSKKGRRKWQRNLTIFFWCRTSLLWTSSSFLHFISVATMDHWSCTCRITSASATLSSFRLTVQS